MMHEERSELLMCGRCRAFRERKNTALAKAVLATECTSLVNRRLQDLYYLNVFNKNIYFCLQTVSKFPVKHYI